MRLTATSGIDPLTVRWPDIETGPWQLVVHLDWVEGRPEPIALDITPLDRTRPAALRTSLLRTLHLPPMVEAHVQQQAAREATEHRSLADAAEDPEQNLDVPQSLLDEMEASYKQLASVRRKPGRPVDVTPSDYRRVAALYDEAYARRVPILKYIATNLGLSESAAAKRVHEARRRGELPPTSRGRARSN
jgi:hypothetical protein